jgi:hypothetical protein
MDDENGCEEEEEKRGNKHICSWRLNHFLRGIQFYEIWNFYR